jgi:hypothetical protein
MERAREHPNNVGSLSMYHRSAEDFILSLASWAHGNKSSQQSVLLLLDDLEAATNLDFDAVQNLRWLLLRGPARRVWPIITLNPQSHGKHQPLAGCFPYTNLGGYSKPKASHMLALKMRTWNLWIRDQVRIA